MGAGSAKGVNVRDEDDEDIDNDRFSVLSHDVAPQQPPPKPTKPNNNNNNNTKSRVRAKIEALSQESEDNEDVLPSVKPSSGEDKKDDEKKKGLFGFSLRKEEDEKTNAFVHEADENNKKKNNKKDNSKTFKFFNFRKEGKKSEEKDERLDQEIKDLQRTFDSLGIVGKGVWDEDQPPKGEGKPPTKSQSADDIRDLEPMRNRINHKRRFSRPANVGGSTKKTEGQTSSGGSKRTFKYSWEKENSISSPVRSEEWNYEAVLIDGFDIDKFKRANFEDSLISASLSNKISNSVSTNSASSSAREIRSPLTYDTTEQKLLANIEMEYV